MLPVQDFSSPQLDDKHRGYTDLLHPCGSAVRARVRNGDATTGRRGTFHPVRHTSRRRWDSRVALPRLTRCARQRIGTDMSPSKLRVGAVRDKFTRPMHSFRTFLGDDDDFSNL